MPDLKPCPFCGSKEILVHRSYFSMSPGESYRVRCKRCPCELGWNYSSMEELTTAWNGRWENGR